MTTEAEVWYVGLPCSNGWLLRSDIGGWLEPLDLLRGGNNTARCLMQYEYRREAEVEADTISAGNLRDGSTIKAVVLSQADLDALLVMESLAD